MSQVGVIRRPRAARKRGGEKKEARDERDGPANRRRKQRRVSIENCLSSGTTPFLPFSLLD